MDTATPEGTPFQRLLVGVDGSDHGLQAAQVAARLARALGACRKPLDGKPLSADSRAYRATRLAPDVIWSTVQGAGAMNSGGDAAAVSLNGTVRVTNREAPGSHRPQASSEGLPSTCWKEWTEL